MCFLDEFCLVGKKPATKRKVDQTEASPRKQRPTRGKRRKYTYSDDDEEGEEKEEEEEEEEDED